MINKEMTMKMEVRRCVEATKKTSRHSGERDRPAAYGVFRDGEQIAHIIKSGAGWDVVSMNNARMNRRALSFAEAKYFLRA